MPREQMLSEEYLDHVLESVKEYPYSPFVDVKLLIEEIRCLRHENFWLGKSLEQLRPGLAHPSAN